MANKRNGTIYTGVTSNLAQRVYQHKAGLFVGFSKKYNCANLVYYEELSDMPTAILREKQLKGGSRKNKIMLIEARNPAWNDLFASLA
jgi:predicted GIY-YIG superfamily endonuclease